jgi:N-hydroxyarylamine O-acetyltransferase
MPMDHATMVAYLNRVDVTAPAAGDAAGLRTLHRAHQLTVPFENLSIHLAEPISLDERDLITRSCTVTAGASATSSTAHSRCCSRRSARR